MYKLLLATMQYRLHTLLRGQFSILALFIATTFSAVAFGIYRLPVPANDKLALWAAMGAPAILFITRILAKRQ